MSGLHRGTQASFPALSAAPANPVAGQVYYDTTNNVTYTWNGRDWVPGGYESVLDEAYWTSPYWIPTTATTVATAAVVPGSTITPYIQATGVLRLSANVCINHGLTGWQSGRAAGAYIGDQTLTYGTGLPPVPTDAQAFTNGGVTGSDIVSTPVGQYLNLEASYPVAATDAGTRTFSLYVYITHVALTSAKVYASQGQRGFVKAELV